MDHTETTVASTPAARTRRRPGRRIFVLLGAALLLTAGAVWLGMWWQDRPLANIAAALNDGEPKQALAAADSYLADHPRDTRAQILKARALSRLERHREADELFKQVAMRSNGFPDDPAALRDWSISLLQLKLWLRVIPMLETLVESNPDDAELLYRLTVSRMRVRQYDAALESAGRLAKIAGHEQSADLLIGTIHHDRGNRRLALERWERLIKSNPRAKGLTVTPGHFFAMIGEEYLELGRPNDTIAVIERVQFKDRSAQHHLLLGNACSQVGRPAEAVRSWKAVLESDRLNPEARENLANDALRRGDAKRAVEWLQPLVTGTQPRSRTTYILERAYGKLKDTARATYWKEQTTRLREEESRRATAKRRLRDSRDPYRAAVLRVNELAEERRFEEAESLVEGLRQQQPANAYLQKLEQALRKRGPLPPLPR